MPSLPLNTSTGKHADYLEWPWPVGLPGTRGGARLVPRHAEKVRHAVVIKCVSTPHHVDSVSEKGWFQAIFRPRPVDYRCIK